MLKVEHSDYCQQRSNADDKLSPPCNGTAITQVLLAAGDIQVLNTKLLPNIIHITFRVFPAVSFNF